ncbi:hypothetical protein Q8F55_008550 [Vanrija albida]|uniref:Uncharacterized protein n=1 Tax=Vanrija albida TaxID=181172 RepID=A0ABR3PR68_9TREE
MDRDDDPAQSRHLSKSARRRAKKALARTKSHPYARAQSSPATPRAAEPAPTDTASRAVSEEPLLFHAASSSQECEVSKSTGAPSPTTCGQYDDRSEPGAPGSVEKQRDHLERALIDHGEDEYTALVRAAVSAGFETLVVCSDRIESTGRFGAAAAEAFAAQMSAPVGITATAYLQYSHNARRWTDKCYLSLSSEMAKHLAALGNAFSTAINCQEGVAEFEARLAATTADFKRTIDDAGDGQVSSLRTVLREFGRALKEFIPSPGDGTLGRGVPRLTIPAWQPVARGK